MYKYVDSKYETALRIFLILIIEIFVPYNFLTYLINNNLIESLSKLEIRSVNIFIVFWIFISYLRGRYSQIKTRNSLKDYILKFRELIIISIPEGPNKIPKININLVSPSPIIFFP